MLFNKCGHNIGNDEGILVLISYSLHVHVILRTEYAHALRVLAAWNNIIYIEIFMAAPLLIIKYYNNFSQHLTAKSNRNV